ncbi:CHAT domain-containing protein [Microbacterium sp. C7(2022)]|uniref:CHAT domain-containing protein n=1 Tax=Microbacterium sp. C7(2022) TaxID=2992759 RepID=UPI00237A36D3|nr:CHAT domain-containing protein [Microbacterium sp. C7(2022)]MDE0545249.1 CHAT domain-containing protein [Microbacterium sp. C7(2022)]
MALPASDLHRRAVALCIDGKYAAAQRELDRAEARTDDPDLRARIAGTRSLAVQRTGDPSRAEQILRDALATPQLQDHTRAVLRGQLGALANYGGRLDDAERWLSEAINGLQDDPVPAARARMNRSLVRMQQRRLADAADDLERSAAIFSEHGLSTDEAQARHNLGYTALLAGDLVDALHQMLAARDDAAASPVAAAVCDVDRAEVLRDAGLVTEAERILANAAATFAAHRMPQSRAEAEFHLARSQLAHDARAARTSAAAAARRFHALGNDAWAARADAIRLRAAFGAARVTLSGSGRAARMPSEETVAQVATRLTAHGFRSEATSLRLAAALARARRGERAARVARISDHATMEEQMLAAELRSARAAAAGRGAQARQHAASGLEALTRWQSSFGSLDLQTSVAMHGANLVFAGLASAISSRRADVVFEWSERARNLAQQAVPLRPPPDEEFAAELAELRMLRAENPGADWLDGARAAHLRNRARERQWSRTRSTDTDGVLDLDSVRSGLDADTAVLSYVFSGEVIAAVAITGDDARVVDVAPWGEVAGLLRGLRADLDMAASIQTGPMAAVVRRSLDQRVAEISRLLLAPLLQIADRRRLVLTVPGALSAIPWSILPAMRGRVFTLAVSASRWARAQTQPVRHQSAGFVVGPRVARGEEEVRAGASGWGGAEVLAEDAATVSAATALAGSVDVLHIAAHGRHSADNPLFSGLELADGALFGYDVDLIPRVPGTVVLSACEVGRSSVRWGEEAVGMTRVWLHAGSRCVIAAPVIVADDDACELLSAMHDGLARGMSPAEALAAASDHTGIVAPFQAHGAGF